MKNFIIDILAKLLAILIVFFFPTQIKKFREDDAKK